MRLLLGFALSLCFVIIKDSASQTYYGYFDPSEVSLQTNTGSSGKYIVIEDFSFTDPDGVVWTTPSGTIVDGASIPWYFWSTFGSPFTEDYIAATVIHVYYCDTQTRTAHATHRGFYYGMRANGVPDWKAKLMYVAVQYLGPDWELTYNTTPECISILDGKRGKIRSDCADIADSEPIWHFSNQPSLSAENRTGIENYMNSIKDQLELSNGASINQTPATLDELDSLVRERKTLDGLIKQLEIPKHRT
jgi:hypothetical protein